MKKFDLEEADAILDGEDDATLAAIDRGIKSAEDGRLVSLEEARRRVQAWPTKSSSLKNP